MVHVDIVACLKDEKEFDIFSDTNSLRFIARLNRAICVDLFQKRTENSNFSHENKHLEIFFPCTWITLC